MGKHKAEHGKTRVGIFLKGLGEVADPILKVASDLTGIEALDVLSDAITTDKELSTEQKKEALSLLKIDLNEVTKRWEHDSKSDSWLPKNIRPLMLAYTMFVVSLFCTLDSTDAILVKDHWVSLFSGLLMTMIIAYFGSRGAEKIMKK
jgi:hypothetical protein